MTEDKVLVTATQACQMLGGISDRTLYRWMHMPNLEFPAPVVMNRRRFFIKDEIQNFITKNQQD